MEECSYSEFSAGPLGLFTTERHKTKNTTDWCEAIQMKYGIKENRNITSISKMMTPYFPLQSVVSTKSQ